MSFLSLTISDDLFEVSKKLHRIYSAKYIMLHWEIIIMLTER